MSKFALAACAAAMLATSQGPAYAAAARSAQQPQPVTDEQAIRNINNRWLELIRAGNAAEIAKIYAENGALMPPNSPAAIGTAAIQKGWQSMIGMPGFALTFEPDEIVVSKGGDMAYDRGTYKFTATPESGPVTDAGKYVVVWRKIAGKWRAVADIFNSNAPAQ